MKNLCIVLTVVLSVPLVMAGELELIYDQTGLPSPNGKAAQNFETAFDINDCFGADEFSFGGSGDQTIEQLLLIGRYKSMGPAITTVNINLISDLAGAPGPLLCDITGVVVTDVGGDLVVDLEPSCTLSPGTYWLSVQVNLDRSVNQWFWESTNSVFGSTALWRNPNAGYRTFCTTWSALPDCFGSNEVSFIFAVYGQSTGIFSDDFEIGNTSLWSYTQP